jgi:hypothetical protein
MNTRAPSKRPRRIVRERSVAGRVAFAAALCDVVADPNNEITGIRIVSTTPETAEMVEEVALQRGLATHADGSAQPAVVGPREKRSVTIRAERPHPKPRGTSTDK